MAAVTDIYKKIDEMAPFATQMGFDNAGLLVGRGSAEVTGILVALDITLDVVREALELGCNLIVAHHPIIFEPVRRITEGDPVGEVLLALTENKVAAICAHTNLDAAQGGVNDHLAQRLRLSDTTLLEQDGVDDQGRPYGIGRVGQAHMNCAPSVYAAFVKEALNAASVRYVDTGKPVEKVAVGGGACGSMLAQALAAGCDTFVTSDVKYNVYLDAKAMGINLMDAGHYATENVVTAPLARYLQAAFPQVPVRLAVRHPEVYSGV